MTDSTGIDKRPVHFHNYCACFIDLLGQREALRGQGLLPTFSNEKEREAFDKSAEKSIKAILNLQTRAEDITRAALKEDLDSPLRAKLDEKEKKDWDEMSRTKVTTQRWSDGIVTFSSLGDTDVKCHMNAVFHMMGLAGSLMLIGLAAGQPLRGAIEIGWAAELVPGELYGAAVARAYELESELAGYPRIVLGPLLMDYLQLHANSTGGDSFAQNDKDLAKICLTFTARDLDGYPFLHYLGRGFQDAITHAVHDDLYPKADRFVKEELKTHKARNSKLAFRYINLVRYFENFAPPEPKACGS